MSTIPIEEGRKYDRWHAKWSARIAPQSGYRENNARAKAFHASHLAHAVTAYHAIQKPNDFAQKHGITLHSLADIHENATSYVEIIFSAPHCSRFWAVDILVFGISPTRERPLPRRTPSAASTNIAEGKFYATILVLGCRIGLPGRFSAISEPIIIIDLLPHTHAIADIARAFDSRCAFDFVSLVDADHYICRYYMISARWFLHWIDYSMQDGRESQHFVRW